MDNVFDSSGDRPDVKNIVLIFTDGASNINPELTIPRAIEARQKGAHIIMFGVSFSRSSTQSSFLLSDDRILQVGDANMLELRAMASRPYPQNMFFVHSFNNFSDVLDSMRQATCDGKILSFGDIFLGALISEFMTDYTQSFHSF